MPITFSCECGKQLRVADEFAGKRAKCPACGEIANVPAGESEYVEEPPRKVKAREVPESDDENDHPRRRPVQRDEVAEEDDRPRKRRRDDEEEDQPRKRRFSDDDERPRRKKRNKSDDADKEENTNNGTIIGGIAMMVGAVVWLVAMDRIFFYPPILFVFGVIAFIKGLVNFAGKD